jgi:hypothetical protein
MTKKQEEAAIRHGIDDLSGVPVPEQFHALLVLRTVAFHLNLRSLHLEIDNMVQKCKSSMEKGAPE